MDKESHQVMDLLSCGYIITKPDGTITYANSFILKLMKVVENEIVGFNLKQLFGLNNKVNNFEKQISNPLKLQKEVKNVNLLITTNNGLLIPVLINAKIVQQLNSNTQTIHYTFFDDVERTKSETELRLATSKNKQLINKLSVSNQKYIELCKEVEVKDNFHNSQTEIYKRISEAGRVGSWEIDLINDVSSCSAVTKQIYEFDENTASQSGLCFFNESTDGEEIIQAIYKTIKTGKTFDIESKITTEKGRKIWVRSIGFAECTNDLSIVVHPKYRNLFDNTLSQKPIRLFGTFQDIDKQKKLLLKLQKINGRTITDNAYLKSIVENNSFYVVKTDLSGNYTYLNPCFLEKMGVNEQDWIGKNSMDFIIPEDHSLCTETVAKCFSHTYKSHSVVLKISTPNGIIINQWEFRLLKDENGNFNEFLSIGYDITPLIKKQEELKNLLDITSIQNTRLHNFTHVISHNIRSHVANLKGIMSITDLEDIKERNIAWKLIEDTVTSLDETIQNLGDIIAIQSEKELPLLKINVYNEISKIVKGVQMLIDKANAQIVYDFDKNENLKTNPAYFESIILNLITNALKYKSPNIDTQIHIGLTKTENFKLLTIKDNGLGIDTKRHKDKLFRMFKTFHKNKDAKGLGLFIIKTQIQAMGGKIEVESEVDKGTTFKVYFLENREI